MHAPQPQCSHDHVDHPDGDDERAADGNQPVAGHLVPGQLGTADRDRDGDVGERHRDDVDDDCQTQEPAIRRPPG